MKAFAFLVTLVLVAVVGAGAWYWNDTQQKLKAKDEEIQRAIADCASTLESTKSMHKSEMEIASVEFEKAIAAAVSEQQQLASSLTDTSERRAAVEKLLSLYTGASERSFDFVKLVFEFQTAMSAMIGDPSTEKFQALSTNLAQMEKALNDVDSSNRNVLEHMKANEALLTEVTPAFQTASERLKKYLDKSTESLPVTEIRKSLRESKFTVLSTDGWQTTDLDVKKGEVVCFSSTGKWLWSPMNGQMVDAKGADTINTMYSVVNNLGNGALLARVRGSEQVFAGIGSIQADRDGKIEFRINDTEVGDNRGAIDVVMWAFIMPQ